MGYTESLTQKRSKKLPIGETWQKKRTEKLYPQADPDISAKDPWCQDMCQYIDSEEID